MQTAKIFLNGRSQAVRLPKDFRFTGDDFFYMADCGLF
ncbi:MAG: AbrB/MazE/SpoVT family DNA-binding domain-containing protein [candidate division Zixibacteria bacterium]|nr:AbrB/MazE/SpoVT family DNA-binding domain-containing protein [candidate division Zixibacteria bacterium]